MKGIGKYHHHTNVRVLKSVTLFLVVVGLLYYQHGFGFWKLPVIASIDGINRLDPYKILHDPLRDRIGKPTLEPNVSHLHRGSSAMVASDVPLCSTMGKSILQQGGNAADAAITVALCIGSINSHSSGIGGGGFILSKNHQDIISIDAREMAPGNAFKDMYNKSPFLSKVGGLAVAIPGELAGLYELYSKHGSGNLSWKQLFDPVIKLNYHGWNCSLVFGIILKIEDDLVFSKVPMIKDQWDFIYNNDSDSFSTPKRLKQEGDWITRPNYAKTLELIANNGSSDIFYDPDGPIVSSLVKTANNLGGFLNKQDFIKYKPKVETPLSANITLPNGKRLNVFTANGVTSGLALISGWNFFNRIYKSDDSDLLITHKLIESFKWLASVRTRLGDVNFHRKQKLIEKYTSTDWITEILNKDGYSDNQTFSWKHYGPKFDIIENQGTSHFSIIDKDGNSIGMTTTVNLLFGSMVYDNSTGIILNNEMDDFSTPKIANAFNLTPSIFNFIAPYKRPLSSTSLTLIVDELNGKPDLMIGAAGGSRIPTAVLQAIIRVYYQGFSILNALSYPRIHHQLIPQYVMVEDLQVFDNEHCSDLRSGLQQLGHTLKESGTLTSMNAIKRNGEFLEGVSDYWRKNGEADGY
jgi:gamma-glutamyltranspeptidase/glutathione hydrolase